MRAAGRTSWLMNSANSALTSAWRVRNSPWNPRHPRKGHRFPGGVCTSFPNHSPTPTRWGQLTGFLGTGKAGCGLGACVSNEPHDDWGMVFYPIRIPNQFGELGEGVWDGPLPLRAPGLSLAGPHHGMTGSNIALMPSQLVTYPTAAPLTEGGGVGDGGRLLQSVGRLTPFGTLGGPNILNRREFNIRMICAISNVLKSMGKRDNPAFVLGNGPVSVFSLPMSKRGETEGGCVDKVLNNRAPRTTVNLPYVN